MKIVVLFFSLFVFLSCATIPPYEVVSEATILSDLSESVLYEATLEWMSTVLPSWNNYDQNMLMADSLFIGATGSSSSSMASNSTNLGVVYQSKDTGRIRAVGQVSVYYAIMSYPVRFNVFARISDRSVSFVFDNMVIARQGGGVIRYRDMFTATLVQLDRLLYDFENFLARNY